MKKILLSAALIAASFTTFAQVGVGTTTPEAALDVVSTDSGVALPRVATIGDITTPINGMTAYAVDEKCFKGYADGAWADLTPCTAVPATYSLTSVASYNGTSVIDATGIGYNGEAVPTASTITVEVNVTDISGGANYTLSATDATTGLEYSASGTFAATGVQNIVLANNNAVIPEFTSGVIALTLAGNATNTLALNPRIDIKSIPASATAVVPVDLGNGQIFMDRNLGARRAANAINDVFAYGNHYQWGRPADGHEISVWNGTTKIAGRGLANATALEALATSDFPGHANFILTNESTTFYDWRAGNNNNRWATANQGPCPAGYHVPTDAQWTAADTFGAWNNNTDTYNSTLKLPSSGYRNRTNGLLSNQGTNGHCWSSTVSGTNARNLNFNSTVANVNNNNRANGFTVRCLKDYKTALCCVLLKIMKVNIKVKKMKKTIVVLIVLMIQLVATAQETFTIKGHFPNFPNSKYELKGYNGLEQTTLTTTKSKEDGTFVLQYPATYKGVAQLYMNNSYLIFFILNKENIALYWEDLTNRDVMQLTGSKEYNAFLKGMKTYQDAEAKLGGLNYLLPLYKKDTIKQQIFIKELDTVNNAFPNYVKALPENLWVRQYLLTKGLIEQMPKSVKTYSWRAPQHVLEFMAIDFKDLKHAGLYKEIIEGYTYLVERFPLEEVVPLLNQAIDKVIGELKHEPTIQQEIAQHWFTFLESHSLTKNAQYLALKMLNQDNYMLTEKSTALFEQYRKMAIGQSAPNIALNNNKSLKKLKNTYKLVAFGTSNCPACKTDYPKLIESYKTLNKTYNLEIVYVSLDTDKTAFNSYYKEAPFITFCDEKGWRTQAAKDYHVFATPTYFLLDKKLKIVAKIKNAAHLESWFKMQK